MKHYSNHTGWERQPPTTTLAALRAPSRYWVISDAQLKRDLQGRTLRDVYRENRARRGVERKYEPRQMDEASVSVAPTTTYGRYGVAAVAHGPNLEAEYLEWCKTRNHTPHPASVDPDHPQNAHRFKAPRVERIAAELSIMDMAA